MKTSVGRTVEHLQEQARPRISTTNTPLHTAAEAAHFSRLEPARSDHVCSGAEEAIPQSHSGKISGWWWGGGPCSRGGVVLEVALKR